MPSADVFWVGVFLAAFSFASNPTLALPIAQQDSAALKKVKSRLVPAFSSPVAVPPIEPQGEAEVFESPIRDAFANEQTSNVSPEIDASETGSQNGKDKPKNYKPTGFLDYNYYFDTRDFNTLAINIGAKLPADIEFFQLFNLDTPLDDPSEVSNFSGFFTEIHFRRPIAKNHYLLKPLDWTLMHADASDSDDVQRIGVRWRLHDSTGRVGHFFENVLKMKYAVNYHFVESDGSGMQVEHVFRRFFFDKRMYVGGFADHNLNKDGSSDWVTETQIGLRLAERFYAVTEFRYNSFLPSGLRSGVGVGLEYLVRFR